jgi:TRAP transporter TAXI family solute receptor
MFNRLLDFVRTHYLWFVAAGVVALLALVTSLVRGTLPPEELTIATGREGGGYYQAALQYQAFAAERGFTIHIRPTAGSQETLELLRSGEVQAGFVQGGLANSSDAETLGALAAVYYEPLWVFYRLNAVEQPPLTYLNQLQGLRIGVGEPGSGTQVLATQLLADNGVTEENAIFVTVGSDASAEQLQSGELDAALIVISPEAAIIEQLIRDETIGLMSVANARAYHSRYPYLTNVVLDQGTVDLAENLPAQSETLLATVATLVVNNELHPDWVRLLVYAANEAHQQGGIFEERYEFPNTQYADLPANPTALAYQQRLQNSGTPVYDEYLPFWASAVVERYVIFILPALLLLVPILARSPSVYQFQVRYRIYRWYRTVRAVERDMTRYSLPQVEQAIDRMEEFQQELTERINVGVFFMKEMYDLRLHVEFVIRRLRQRQRMLMEQQGLPLPEEQPAPEDLVVG